MTDLEELVKEISRYDNKRTAKMPRKPREKRG